MYFAYEKPIHLTRYGVQMLMEMMTLTGPGRLKTNSFLDTSGQKSQCPAFAISHNFGAHFGDQNLLVFITSGGHFFEHFVITFWTTFRHILGPILGPDRPKKGQEEPEMAIKRIKDPKSCISKNLNLSFSMFLGSRGLLREPQGAQEGSQEAPKELQNL